MSNIERIKKKGLYDKVREEREKMEDSTRDTPLNPEESENANELIDAELKDRLEALEDRKENVDKLMAKHKNDPTFLEN
jgi:hypothetical protein